MSARENSLKHVQMNMLCVKWLVINPYKGLDILNTFDNRTLDFHACEYVYYVCMYIGKCTRAPSQSAHFLAPNLQYIQTESAHRNVAMA